LCYGAFPDSEPIAFPVSVPITKRREYKTYVHTIDVLAILQAKAPALLRRSADGR